MEGPAKHSCPAPAILSRSSGRTAQFTNIVSEATFVARANAPAARDILMSIILATCSAPAPQPAVGVSPSSTIGRRRVYDCSSMHGQERSRQMHPSSARCGSVGLQKPQEHPHESCMGWERSEKRTTMLPTVSSLS